MKALTRIRLRTLLWLPVPLTLVIGVPSGLGWMAHQAPGWPGGGWPWLGVWLVANGLGLVGWCVHLFTVEGHGTPLPFDPPRRFVVRGPYQYVRNPMVLGMWLLLGGQSLLWVSWAVAGYAIALVCLSASVVRFWEEPELARRFGPVYLSYRQQVPRWLPFRDAHTLPVPLRRPDHADKLRRGVRGHHAGHRRRIEP